MLQKKKRFSFGPFTLDAAEFVLICSGREIKLEPKAFDLLVFFVHNAGELVNREQIRLAVWGDVHLEKNNIDQKIAAIRRVFSGHDRSREYIQNHRGRGWRFSVEVIEEPEMRLVGETAQATPAPQVPLAFFQLSSFGDASPLLAITSVVALAAIAAAVFAPKVPASRDFEPEAVTYRQVTTDGRPKGGPLVIDGQDVYFSERMNDAENGPLTLAAAPMGGGKVYFPSNPINAPALILGVAQNNRDKLYGRWDPESGFRLFVWRHEHRQLENAGSVQTNARISPDARSIAYASVSRPPTMIIRDLAGRSDVRRVRVSGEPGPPIWSPDGRRIRFSVRDSASETTVFWEVGRDGSSPHRLPPTSRPKSHWPEGCWTADGHYFIFSEVSNGASSLWMLREGSTPKGHYVQLTNNPMSFDFPAASVRGSTVFARGSLSKDRLDRYDASRGQFTPLWEGVVGSDVNFSKDGVWAAFRDPTDDTLWITKSAGSLPRQLTKPPLRAYQPHWSPDANRIAFMGQLPNQPSRIYVIGASGGQPLAVKPTDTMEQGVPSWSGDGRSLVFGELRQRRSDDEMVIRLLDLKSGKETILPGSQGKWTPRWSPNGRYIVAVATNFGSLALFDCMRQRWTPLVTGRQIQDPAWSLDSRFVHFSAETSDRTGVRTLFRVRIDDSVVERLTPPPSQIRWSGVGPDGSPLVLNSTRIEDIYAIDFK